MQFKENSWRPVRTTFHIQEIKKLDDLFFENLLEINQVFGNQHSLSRDHNLTWNKKEDPGVRWLVDCMGKIEGPQKWGKKQAEYERMREKNKTHWEGKLEGEVTKQNGMGANDKKKALEPMKAA